MKTTDKITQEEVIDILGVVGLEANENEPMFYCYDSDKYVDVKIKGNKLEHLVCFIKSYYYDMGYNYGIRNGERNKMQEIKKVLDMM